VNRNFRRVLALLCIAALFIVVFLSLRSGTRPAPSVAFVGYTNNGGQLEAIFRNRNVPSALRGNGVTGVGYLTSTGWAKPSLPTYSFRSWGWDGSNSFTAVTAENTNLPMRIVTFYEVRRSGLSGIWDKIGENLERVTRKTPTLRGEIIWFTNETVPAVAK
jgi:hypothetical protein